MIEVNIDVEPRPILEILIESVETSTVIEIESKTASSWSNLIGRPVASADDVDSAVGVKHTHNNTDVIDALSDVTGDLSYNGSLLAKIEDLSDLVENTDTRLSDSREWVADTVTQAEAEAGVSTERKAWTAERVKQAIDANATGGSDNNANILIWQGI